MIPDRELASLLLEAQLIDRKRLDEASALQKRHGGDLYNVIIENGFVDEERTIRLVAQRLSLRCVSLRDFEADPETLELVPADIARRYRVVAVGIGDRNALFLAMANPLDMSALQAVGDVARCAVVALLAGPLDIERTLERIYDSPERATGAFMDGLFMAPSLPASLSDELDDVIELPSLDDDLGDLDLGDGDELLVQGHRGASADLLDLYDAPREIIFNDDDAFLPANDLSVEGRKRLEEAMVVEEQEIVRPGKGKTAAFRGWDDDDEIDPATVDRGLFTAPPPPRPPAGASSTRGPGLRPPAVSKPNDTPRASTSQQRRVLPTREMTTPLPPTPAPPASSTQPPPPPPGSSRLPNATSPSSTGPGLATPPLTDTRIGAAVAELPRQAGSRRMGRTTGSNPSIPAQQRMSALEAADTHDLLIGLVRALIRRGVLSEQDILSELPSARKGQHVE